MDRIEKQKLRSGYTTGTYASAAAKAAAVFLLAKKEPGEIAVCLGNGKKASFWPMPAPGGPGGEKEKKLDKSRNAPCWWKLKKDAGDDPDVTNGVWVYASVLPLSKDGYQELCHAGKGYVSDKYPGLYLNGGKGIGIAFKKGLSCPPGHYAINPVPRAMIFEAVEEVRKEAGYEGGLEIRIAIPEGTVLASKTFNPRLGIEGGISVLGTTGIVCPMSEQALVETIRLDMRMKAAAGHRVLLMTPGNYGEVFLQKVLGVPLGEGVKCSNFVGASVLMAVEEGFDKLLFVGHIGKLVKVAGGMANTHSQYGDHRMEQMLRLTELASEQGDKDKESLCRDKGTGTRKICWDRERIHNANTTEEVIGYLQTLRLAEPVLACAAAQVKEQITEWTDGRLETEVMVFSSAHKLAGKTPDAEKLLRDYFQKRQKGQEEAR